MYFSNDPNGNGFALHETDITAKDEAQDALKHEKTWYEGYSSDVTDICWGVVLEKVKEVPGSRDKGYEFLDYELTKTRVSKENDSSIDKISENDKFLHQCLEGKANLEDIDNFIDDWHDGNSEEKLHEFLGLSKNEYALYVEKPTALPYILMLHRHEKIQKKIKGD